MGAEYTHAVTVNDQQTSNAGPAVLPAGVPTVLQAWRANARARQQLTFRAFIDNQGVNAITSVTIRGASTIAGANPYSETNAFLIFPGERAWFEAPGPPPEFWQLEATSAAGTTCAFGYSECYIVAQ